MAIEIWNNFGNTDQTFANFQIASGKAWPPSARKTWSSPDPWTNKKWSDSELFLEKFHKKQQVFWTFFGCSKHHFQLDIRCYNEPTIWTIAWFVSLAPTLKSDTSTGKNIELDRASRSCHLRMDEATAFWTKSGCYSSCNMVSWCIMMHHDASWCIMMYHESFSIN